MNHCPHDGDILASNDVAGYRYYSCETCGGVWIPGGVIDRALSARGVQELRKIPSAGISSSTCPDCHALLVMMVVDGCTLDSCHRCHGVWLDAGEAQRVREWFPEGSAIVEADSSRTAQDSNQTAGAISVVDAVANLLVFMIK